MLTTEENMTRSLKSSFVTITILPILYCRQNVQEGGSVTEGEL